MCAKFNHGGIGGSFGIAITESGCLLLTTGTPSFTLGSGAVSLLSGGSNCLSKIFELVETTVLCLDFLELSVRIDDCCVNLSTI